MSFLAKLKLGENSYTVLNADYEVSQRIDSIRMPVGQSKLGLINIVVESSSKVELLAWAVKNDKKDGEITFFKKDNNATLKDLKFFDGYCIHFRESFDAEGSIPMRIFITVAARKIECSGTATEDDKWPGFEGSKAASPGGKTKEVVSFNPNE
jgi:hypothetical protein